MYTQYASACSDNIPDLEPLSNICRWSHISFVSISYLQMLSFLANFLVLGTTPIFLLQANILALGARTIFSVQDQYSWCKTNIFIAGKYSCSWCKTNILIAGQSSCSWCKATWWTSCTGRTVAGCETRLGIRKLPFFSYASSSTPHPCE